MAVAKLVFDLVGRDKASDEFRKVGQAAKGLAKDTDGVSGAFGRLGTAGRAVAAGLAAVAAAAVTREIVQFGAAAVTAASDLQEVQTAVGAVFGAESAEQLKKWSATAWKTMGQSSTEALAGAKTFGVFGKAAGLTGDELAGFSMQMSVLASDLASFHNTSPAEAIEAIGAALRGETEPIRKYGVMLDDAALKARAMQMGIYAGTGALTQQQKVLAAQAEILAQTSDAQGDFARTSTGYANASRVVAAGVKDVTARIGAGLLPVVEKFTGKLVELMPSMMDSIDAAMPQVTATLSSFGDRVMAAWPDIEDSIRSVASAVKTNWTEIKETFTTVGDALARVGAMAKTLWDAFRALPPEVQTTLATLAILQKSGAIKIGFDVVGGVKDLITKVAGMSITAGVVKITGAANFGDLLDDIPGMSGKSKATAGVAGAAPAAGVAGLGAGAAAAAPWVAAFAAAVGVFAAGAALISGSTVDDTAGTGGNTAVAGGTYAMMGGAQSGYSSQQQAAAATSFATSLGLAASAQERLTSAVAAGITTSKNASAEAEGFARALAYQAQAAGASEDEFNAVAAAVAAMPAGASIAQITAQIESVGRQAGMTDDEIAALTSSVLGIPGGASLDQISLAMRAAGEASGATTTEINYMRAAVAGIPGGATIEQLMPRLQAVADQSGITGTQLAAVAAAVATLPPGSTLDVVAQKMATAGAQAGLTEGQVATLTTAVAGIPPGTPLDEVRAKLEATGARAGLTTGEIGVLTGAVLGIPPTGTTTISAPGAAQAAADVRGLNGEVNAVRTVNILTFAAWGIDSVTRQVNMLAAAVTALPRAMWGAIAGNKDGGIVGFAAGGLIPVRVSNGETYLRQTTAAKIGYQRLDALNEGRIVGPGGPRSDSITALAEPGGFVLTAAATRRIARGYADGGVIGGASATGPATGPGAPTIRIYLDGRELRDSFARYERSQGR